MGGKHVKHDDWNIVSKCFSCLKDKGSELLVAIIAGVIAGIILLLVTPCINRNLEKEEAAQALRNNLSAMSLGMSSNYIDEMFGSPMVSQILPSTTFSLEEEGNSGNLTSSAYKLKNCVLLCLYYDNSLVAFVVVVNSENLYEIPPSIYMEKCYLLDFTYADFSKSLNIAKTDLVKGNVPADNDHLAYYFEVYYGANPANYNSFIIGTYKDYLQESDSFMLMIFGQQFYLSEYGNENSFPILSDEEKEECLKLRTLVKPNVFGVVDRRFSYEFDFVDHVVGSRSNASLLFDDWVDELNDGE